MKKYIILSIIAAMFFNGCVKDEQPAPGATTSRKILGILL